MPAAGVFGGYGPGLTGRVNVSPRAPFIVNTDSKILSGLNIGTVEGNRVTVAVKADNTVQAVVSGPRASRGNEVFYCTLARGR